ncbi:Endophilin-A3-like isoform X4 [Oopsacas minuta]|uniref:Endophilin-A3-like isoform X4 n=1 Tax=Oopsacas minuta TaxID=111878 RepID=A0AAV7JRK4_9METZ|nr:Endophilin-A3-like isoform X4 [Oopsacas minuta]
MAKILSRKVDRTKQILSEKTGRGKEEATQIAGEYKDLEKMTDSTAAILEHLQGKLKEMLQPNPNVRLKMDMSNSFQKMKGQVSANKYPQTEHVISELMMKGAQDLGDDSYFSKSLFQVAETFQILSDSKDDLDLSVRQRFLDPIAAVVNKDIKEISHHRKKVTGRRLDYDAKRKKHQKGTVTEQELSLSADRFEESFDLAEKGMRTLLDNDIEQVQQVLELTRSLADYHKRSSETLQSCLEELEDIATAAKTKPPLPSILIGFMITSGLSKF